MRHFKNEAEMAEKVVAWLEADQWDVYQEVQLQTGGRVADIVATRGPLIMIVECKLSCGLDILEQLHEWEGDAHYIVGATPSTPNRMFDLVLQRFNYGRIVVNSFSGVVQHRYGQFWRRPPGADRLRRSLTPDHKTFAKAGNADCSRFTPYQSTCKKLLEIVTANPGIAIKQIMAQLKGFHHYASDSSARGSLLKWARAGSIKGVRVETIGRNIFFHPTAASLKVSEITK
jgi:hypothetical protein